MREFLALTRRNLLEGTRGRAGRLVAVLLGLAVLLPTLALMTSPTSALWAALGLLLALALAVAAASGGRLPRDRSAGRAAWLRTLAPPPTLVGLAAAVAGMAMAVVVAVCGSLLLFLLIGGRAPSVRHARDVALPGDRVRLATSYTLRVGPPLDPSDTLVMVLYRADAFRLPIRIQWEAGALRDDRLLAPGEPLRIEGATGITQVRLHNMTEGTDLVVRAVQVLGSGGSFLGSLLLAGLGLGLVAAAIAPVSVFVSRLASAPTAVAAGYVLGVLGLLRPWLFGLVPPDAPPAQGFALHALETFAHLAPDVGVVRLALAPAAGHALAPSSSYLAALLPLLVYGLVGLLLLALPLPRMLRPEERT